ncbi:MAG: DUF5119 domain-containing protein [Paludibacteraceae bacterium]|nr:DUF5119 domain-containing protein [Paludibacteraceae bacterium]
MTKTRLYIVLCVACAICACTPWYDYYQRRPLERYYDGAVIVRLHTHWVPLGEHPELMTVLLARDGDSIVDRYVTDRVDSMDMRLDAGNYKLIVMNETFADYQTMAFHDTWSYSDIAARSNIREDITYTVPGRHNAPAVRTRENSYVWSPGVIGTAVDSFTITEEQVEQYRRFVPYQEAAVPDTMMIHLYDTVSDMTCRLHVYVRTDSIERMRAVEASAMTGMADGFYLSRVWRTADTCMLWLEDWEQHRGTLAEVSGQTLEGDSVRDWMVCHTSTFGIRHGKERAEDRMEEDNSLWLMYRLRTGGQVTYRYQVGKILHYRDVAEDIFAGDYTQRLPLRGSLQLDIDIVIDEPFDYPVLPTEGDTIASFFDVTVEPWAIGDSTSITM